MINDLLENYGQRATVNPFDAPRRIIRRRAIPCGAVALGSLEGGGEFKLSEH